MTLEYLNSFILKFSPFFLWYFALINFAYCFFLFIGSMNIFYRRFYLTGTKPIDSVKSIIMPSIGFIIPFFNEDGKIFNKVENLIHLNYPNKKIYLVNDGSKKGLVERLIGQYEFVQIPQLFDNTLETKNIIACYQSKSQTNLFLIDKEHGTKYDALNCGINATDADYLITTDVDTLVDEKGFKSILEPVFSDPTLIACGTSIRILNGYGFSYTKVFFKKFSQGILPIIQTIEYLRSFFIRIGINALNTNFVVAGAFSIFPRKILLELGGFAPTVAEDMEIIMRMQRLMRKHKRPFKIFYIPDPVAWTEVPETLKHLGRQRSNWHRGLIECFWFHKVFFLNPRYGLAGLLGYPFGLFCEILEPLVELIGYISIFFGIYFSYLNYEYVILMLSFSLGFTFFFSISCLFVEELSFNKFPKLKATISLVVFSLFENFGYRQLSIFWRLRGILEFFIQFPRIHKEHLKIKKLMKSYRLSKTEL